jgi:hypothetical protein
MHLKNITLSERTQTPKVTVLSHLCEIQEKCKSTDKDADWWLPGLGGGK